MVVCPAREELRRYLIQDDSLSPEQVERIVAHIEVCSSCQALLDELTNGACPRGTTLPDLPGYRIYKHLGAGAFGEVWLAQDLNLPRVVAVKTLKLSADPARRDKALDALRRDAHLLTDVDHPNVVRVHSWLTVHDHHYLVMQYISGGSLADLVKSDGPLDWQRAARYVADVGEGLLDVHARGIVHRDVKPANILWDPRRDEAVLTDFGVGARLDDAAAVAGSIPYMAPEAFDGQVSPSLDVYSLAATFFHLVTGSSPFSSSRIAELKAEIARGLPDPDPRCAGLPEPLERILRAGLAADVGRRPGLKDFVSQLRGTLNQLLVDTITMPARPTEPVPSTDVAPGAWPKTTGGPTTEPMPPQRPALVELRLIVSRQVGPDHFVPVAATHPQQPAGHPTRDMKKVPPFPDQVRLRTGDRVRIEVVADREGYLTVFNVGPTGNLNLLHPDNPEPLPAPPLVPTHRPLHVVDVEMTPPAGRERLFAVWSRQPLHLEHLAGLADPGAPSTPYRATRDMKRVQESVRRLEPEGRHVVVVEVEHVP